MILKKIFWGKGVPGPQGPLDPLVDPADSLQRIVVKVLRRHGQNDPVTDRGVNLRVVPFCEVLCVPPQPPQQTSVFPARVSTL